MTYERLPVMTPFFRVYSVVGHRIAKFLCKEESAEPVIDGLKRRIRRRACVFSPAVGISVALTVFYK
jgi:hypothetical protein